MFLIKNLINCFVILFNMDEKDLKILNVLNKNARISYRNITREINVSLSTVANRIKNLEEEGIIKNYIPLVDFEKIGYNLTVLINLKITHGKLIETQKKISLLPNVYAVYDITGNWDSLVIARFKNRRDLNKFVKNILTYDNVEQTNTQLVLNIVKEDHRFNM